MNGSKQWLPIHVHRNYRNRKDIFQLVRTTGTKLPDDIKRTFPDLIRLVGRESQEIVSETLLLTVDIEGTGLEFPFCFTAGPSFVGEVLAGVGELL
jgi:hypothetical protein